MASVALYWADVDRHVLTSRLPEAVVLVPTGATEQHGPVAAPLGPAQSPVAVAGGRVVRRDRLGGLIGEYSQGA